MFDAPFWIALAISAAQLAPTADWTMQRWMLPWLARRVVPFRTSGQVHVRVSTSEFKEHSERRHARPLTGLGQVQALQHVANFLAGRFPALRLAVQMSEGDPIKEGENRIFIGGPARNAFTRNLLDHINREYDIHIDYGQVAAVEARGPHALDDRAIRINGDGYGPVKGFDPATGEGDDDFGIVIAISDGVVGASIATYGMSGPGTARIAEFFFTECLSTFLARRLPAKTESCVGFVLVIPMRDDGKDLQVHLRGQQTYPIRAKFNISLTPQRR